MTGIYEFNAIPHRVDVLCPQCRQRAAFEFAEIVRIKLKRDVAFFQASSVFEYRQFQDSCGHLWHAALYFEGLHGSPEQAIHALPPGYAANDWAHSRYLRSRCDFPVGAIRCAHCQLRQKHALRWPDDAYYSLAHRGQVLWAYDRESAVELLEFLSSTTRKESRYRWTSFLRHVPTSFKTSRARDAVTRQLRKLLAS